MHAISHDHHPCYAGNPRIFHFLVRVTVPMMGVTMTVFMLFWFCLWHTLLFCLYWLLVVVIWIRDGEWHFAGWIQCLQLRHLSVIVSGFTRCTFSCMKKNGRSCWSVHLVHWLNCLDSKLWLNSIGLVWLNIPWTQTQMSRSQLQHWVTSGVCSYNILTKVQYIERDLKASPGYQHSQFHLKAK